MMNDSQSQPVEPSAEAQAAITLKDFYAAAMVRYSAMVKELAAESVPEPEAVQAARQILLELESLINAGEVEALSCYVQMRDGTYRNLQSCSVSRHEDAGRILELALNRLGFSNGLPPEEE